MEALTYSLLTGISVAFYNLLQLQPRLSLNGSYRIATEDE
jgi:hypothetical protein